MLCASSLAMALLLLAGWLRERTLWKTKERNRRRYKKTGEGGNGSQVPRANPGCHLELTKSASVFFAGSVSFLVRNFAKMRDKE